MLKIKKSWNIYRKYQSMEKSFQDFVHMENSYLLSHLLKKYNLFQVLRLLML